MKVYEVSGLRLVQACKALDGRTAQTPGTRHSLAVLVITWFRKFIATSEEAR